MIEQFGVRWWFTLPSEVVQSAGEPVAEKELPCPVDECPGGERVLLGDDPLGQVHTGGPFIGGFKFAQKLRDGGLDFVSALVEPVSPGKNLNHAGCPGLGNEHGPESPLCVGDSVPGFLEFLGAFCRLLLKLFGIHSKFLDFLFNFGNSVLFDKKLLDMPQTSCPTDLV